jgi:hypothetical protein
MCGQVRPIAALVVSPEKTEVRSQLAAHLKPLFLIHEMATAVLLPTSFVGFSAERLLLAVADRLDVAGADSTLR